MMIAMIIACRTKLLIADEPTIALDVTIPKRKLSSCCGPLQQIENMALVLITHDLMLIAKAAHYIIVMYAGQGGGNQQGNGNFQRVASVILTPRRCCPPISGLIPICIPSG
ncbi:hypothetical protein BG74_01110 [Sodalis-like endosymbiont of Proechinophthirus fluctus]|nr:hypothetical protein BG74_07090 [Sodalis-like endosymbiont of Proechinophthirus fluctus]KYP96953.1 hypothetical protein BG74_06650 [Sodalis-like endosymbiont of Proechinophthirus fluctus]KYP97716.1 hypothetical protein BG74_01110 [Sodalis-like endosymbiont of Proechinophthirus fluctus]